MKEKTQENKIFGVPLAEIMKRGENVHSDIPVILKLKKRNFIFLFYFFFIFIFIFFIFILFLFLFRETVDYVLKYGLESEGIFRQNGLKKDIERICDYYDHGAKIQLDKFTSDEHTGKN